MQPEALCLLLFVCAWSAFLRYEHGGRLLDLGSGSGQYLATMRTLGWEVYGIDPDAGAVQTAKEHFNIESFHGTMPSPDADKNAKDGSDKSDKTDAPPAAAGSEASVGWEVALVRDVPKTGGVVARLPRGPTRPISGAGVLRCKPGCVSTAARAPVPVSSSADGRPTAFEG